MHHDSPAGAASLRATALTAALSTLVVATLAAVWWMAPVGPAAARSAGNQVYGRVAGPGNSSVKVKVGLFTRDWTWVRNVTSGPGGVYRMDHVKPGKYWLQFSDARPRYDVTSFATRNVKLTVGHQSAVERDAILHRGSYITGTVYAGPHGNTPAKRPKLIAAAAGGATFTVLGNAEGQFALGGLPAGSYSLFTYDKQGQWSGRSTWVGGLKAGHGENVAIRLGTRSSAYGGFLKVGQHLTTGTVWVTAVNKATGQFYVEPVHRGDLGTLRGLFPGRYKLHISATDLTRGRTVTLPEVAPGHTRTITVRVRAKPPKPKPSTRPSVSPSASGSHSSSPSTSPSSPTSASTSASPSSPTSASTSASPSSPTSASSSGSSSTSASSSASSAAATG